MKRVIPGQSGITDKVRPDNYTRTSLNLNDKNTSLIKRLFSIGTVKALSAPASWLDRRRRWFLVFASLLALKVPATPLELFYLYPRQTEWLPSLSVLSRVQWHFLRQHSHIPVYPLTDQPLPISNLHFLQTALQGEITDHELSSIQRFLQRDPEFAKRLNAQLEYLHSLGEDFALPPKRVFRLLLWLSHLRHRTLKMIMQCCRDEAHLLNRLSLLSQLNLPDNQLQLFPFEVLITIIDNPEVSQFLIGINEYWQISTRQLVKLLQYLTRQLTLTPDLLDEDHRPQLLQCYIAMLDTLLRTGVRLLDTSIYHQLPNIHGLLIQIIPEIFQPDSDIETSAQLFLQLLVGQNDILHIFATSTTAIDVPPDTMPLFLWLENLAGNYPQQISLILRAFLQSPDLIPYGVYLMSQLSVLFSPLPAPETLSDCRRLLISRMLSCPCHENLQVLNNHPALDSLVFLQQELDLPPETLMQYLEMAAGILVDLDMQDPRQFRRIPFLLTLMTAAVTHCIPPFSNSQQFKEQCQPYIHLASLIENWLISEGITGELEGEIPSCTLVTLLLHHQSLLAHMSSGEIIAGEEDATHLLGHLNTLAQMSSSHPVITTIIVALIEHPGLIPFANLLIRICEETTLEQSSRQLMLASMLLTLLRDLPLADAATGIAENHPLLQFLQELLLPTQQVTQSQILALGIFLSQSAPLTGELSENTNTESILLKILPGIIEKIRRRQ